MVRRGASAEIGALAHIGEGPAQAIRHRLAAVLHPVIRLARPLGPLEYLAQVGRHRHDGAALGGDRHAQPAHAAAALLGARYSALPRSWRHLPELRRHPPGTGLSSRLGCSADVLAALVAVSWFASATSGATTASRAGCAGRGRVAGLACEQSGEQSYE